MILTPDKIHIIRAMRILTEKLLKAADDEALVDMEMRQKSVPGFLALADEVARASGEWEVIIRVRHPLPIPGEMRLLRAG